MRELRTPASASASVNITTDLEPSVVADAGHALPFASGSFRTVLTLNTLEHLRDDGRAVAECLRVLRPGGELHIFVPFLYRVHGHPDDFRRNTASGWAEVVGRTLGPGGRIVVEPLAWDPLSTAWSIADVAPLGRWWWRLRRFVRPVVLGRPLLFGVVDRRSRDRAAELVAQYAVAYYVVARKAP